MVGVGDDWMLYIFGVIIFVLWMYVVVAECDMVFWFPCVKFMVVSLPLDEAVLPI
jgi:hypothetical protein